MHLHAAETVLARIEALARCSEEPDRLTRRFATPALAEAQTLVAEWMRAAGMTVRRDAIGNLIGHYPGGEVDAPVLLLGSHLDSVRDAGKYDGPLGVLVALAVVERLRERGAPLPFAIDLLAFADEEGLRYGTAYLGSHVVAGTFDPAMLALVDADGITMAAAIAAAGGDPARLAQDRYRPEAVLGYCEVHIEQGPLLEAEGLPVGVVSAIVGQSRVAVRFVGEAGHAGTVPMALRHDALCAAAEFVLAVEALGREEPGLVATVGQLAVQPGASNVIPGLAELSLDLRHGDDLLREAGRDRLRARAEQIAAARKLRLDWTVLQETRSVPCAPDLTASLARAVQDSGYGLCALVSGAGHDAVTLAQLTRVAMLFVRCAGGVSHNPAESVAVADVAVAIAVLARFVDLVAARHRPAT